MLRLFVLGLAAVLVAGTAHANLLQNGDFELGPNGRGLVNGNDFDAMPGRAGSRSWDVWTSLPGWTTTGGAGIEVQTRRTVGGADAQSGAYYIELDSHPRGRSNSTMAQSVDLTAGKYVLSYWYQPRTGRPGDNVIAAMFDGIDLAVQDETSKTQGGWVQYFANIDVATAGTYTVGFAARGLENTLGGFIDNVELSQVPLPAALPLMGAGLAGLAFWRRRQQA